MNRQRQEVEEKVFSEVIAGSGALVGKARRRGRKSVGVRGVANQEIVSTLRANNILTDSITFTNGNGSIAINVGPIGTSNVNQGTYAIAIGSNAGKSNQGTYAVAIGTDAGRFSQGQYSFAIGTQAGESNSAVECINIGFQAGQCNSSVVQKSIAIGTVAGQNFQGCNSIAVGSFAGRQNQRSQSIAIGDFAGEFIQGNKSVACGASSGRNFQGSNTIAIGLVTGNLNQSQNSVAIGQAAGNINQREFNVSIGPSAGTTFAGTGAVAIGNLAGYLTQGSNAVAVGYFAGLRSQRAGSIAIGAWSGLTNQGSNCIQIGLRTNIDTTIHSQTSNCIAIGINAGAGTTQLQNTICLGAFTPTSTQNSCYINPIRQDFGAPSPGVLSYDTTTGEVFQDIGKTFVIDHPSKENKYLVYACLESNDSGVFYKGQSEIKGDRFGEIEIFIPDYIKPIATNFMIFVSSRQKDRKIIASPVINNEKFKIIGHPCIFDWIIYGTRHTTFESVVDKKSKKIGGEGPYTFLS